MDKKGSIGGYIFLITIIVILAAIITAVVIGSNGKGISQIQSNKTVKTYSTTTTTPTPTPEKHEYTGSCTIVGSYRKRTVSCSGDYDPEAKARAEVKAKECNESAKAVSGCTSIYK